MPDGNDEQQQLIRSRSASGGINTRVHPLDIRQDQAVSLQNIDTSTPGQRTIRPGMSVPATGFSGYPGPLLALSAFKPDGGNTELVALSPGTDNSDNLRLWTWDGTGGEWTEAATVSGFDNDGSDYELIPAWDDELNSGAGGYGMHIGSNKVVTQRWTWDGSALATMLGPLGGQRADQGAMDLGFFYGRMWAAGREDSAGTRNVLYFSDTFNWLVTGWDAAGTGGTNSTRLGGGKDGRIVAVQDFRANELLVFMGDRLEELIVDDGGFTFAGGVLPTAWARRVISPCIGCSSRRSVAVANEDVFFADQAGNIRSVARTALDSSQGIRSLPVSEPIDSWIKRINPAAKNKIECISHDRWLIVSLPIDTATVASHIFVLDLARSAGGRGPVWDGPWTGLTPGPMVEAFLNNATSDGDKDPRIWLSNTATAVGDMSIRRFLDGTDDAGDAITFQETTKRIAPAGLDFENHWTRIEMFAVASAAVTGSVEASVDAQGFQTVGHFSFLGDGVQLPQEVPFNLGGAGVVADQMSLDHLTAGRDIQFRFTATATDQISLLGYSLLGFSENHDWREDW